MPESPDGSDLEPLTPEDALQLYEQSRRNELAEQTLQSHRYRITRFLEWCEEEAGIDNMNDVGGRDIQRFKIWRSEQVNTTTLKSNLDTLRVWIRFCEGVQAVRDGVSESINSPSLNGSKTTQDIVTESTASEILAYLSKYEYASVEHVVIRLLWETGCRAGTLRGVDLDTDVHLSAEYIEAKHRPETGTPLKNQAKGERAIAISTRTCNILRDYIDHHRYDRTDSYNRTPLVTTRHGRITINTIRCYAYRVTRPCMYGRDCPHDRDPDSCEAVESRMTASKCPDSSGTHALRRGAITHYLESDIPADIVSDRLDVQKRTLAEVYDYRSERDKMELRREYFDDL